jgi:hypothetical protein
VAETRQYQKVAGGAKQVVDNWKPSFRIDPSWEMVEVCEINKETLDIVEDLEYQYIDISSVENGTGKIVFGDRILEYLLTSRSFTNFVLKSLCIKYLHLHKILV